MTEDEMFEAIRSELARARRLFPGKNLTLVALMEEVGELAKAAMDEEPYAVQVEAIQVCVMAMRVVLDGDVTVEYRRAQSNVEPLIDYGPDFPEIRRPSNRLQELKS